MDFPYLLMSYIPTILLKSPALRASYIYQSLQRFPYHRHAPCIHPIKRAVSSAIRTSFSYTISLDTPVLHATVATYPNLLTLPCHVLPPPTTILSLSFQSHFLGCLVRYDVPGARASMILIIILPLSFWLPFLCWLVDSLPLFGQRLLLFHLFTTRVLSMP